MTAATADRNTKEREGVYYSYPVAAATKIYAGTQVCLDASGNAVPAADATGLTRVVGRAEEQVDNSSGAAGDKYITVKAGIFAWTATSAGKAYIGDTAYVLYDNQVALTTNSYAVISGDIVDVLSTTEYFVKNGL